MCAGKNRARPGSCRHDHLFLYTYHERARRATNATRPRAAELCLFLGSAAHAVLTAAVVPTSCATKRKAMAATPSSNAELLGSEQRLPSSFMSFSCDTNEPLRSGNARRRARSRGGQPYLDLAEFRGEGAGEGDGAEEHDDATDGGAAGRPAAPLLHRALNSVVAHLIRLVIQFRARAVCSAAYLDVLAKNNCSCHLNLSLRINEGISTNRSP
uniref:Uncharacterized protein n=1 Tax=Zea mays TaxID=4577 RepID=C0PGL9_MAIZE|nr:unknown [Zea mays]